MIDTPALKQMPETRQRILELIKQNGGMTADQMSKSLGITSMGVRQHLVALERDGLVAYKAEQRGMGRPKYIYYLTDAGDELFPRSYPQLVNSFIEATRAAFGEKGIDQVFAARNESLQGVYEARLKGKDLAGKVAELAKIRSEEGYMADWEQKDKNTFYLNENNCAICQVAKQCLNACTFELKLFQTVLPEAEITREDHIMNGDRACTYVIRKKTKK